MPESTRKNDIVEERLEYIFKNVNDHLRFAESKNGALVALNSGLIFGYLSFLPYSFSNIPWFILVYSVSFTLLNVTAIIIGLISFVPITQLKRNNKDHVIGKDNYLFFDHISNYSEEDLLERIYTDHGLSSKEKSKYSIQVCNQIVINSTIAKRKFKLFSFAVWATIFAILTPIFGSLVLFMTRAINSKNGNMTSSVEE